MAPLTHEDIQIELARTMRELEQRVRERLAQQHLGEDFVDLEPIKKQEKLT